jgi:uncharacterized protein (TIGR01244 family)
MTEFRPVTPSFAVSPQIAPEDLTAAKAAGFTLIVNNRPDGESPGQPSGAEIEAAARAEGLVYTFVPVRGRPTQDQVYAVSSAVMATSGKTLAYCRSGNRSIMTWALGELTSGARSRDELLRLAAAAGYDLSGVLPG